MTRLQHFTARTAEGEEVSLTDLAGKATLVVNLASKCGLTPQLDGLQALQEEYEERGLRIIGFPCDQFGGQMPGTDEEAVTFCRTEYGVTFPVLAKVEVNGENAHPLWAWMEQEKPGADGPDVEWNFAKFLLDADGQVIERFSPRTEPVDLRGAVEAALA